MCVYRNIFLFRGKRNTVHVTNFFFSGENPLADEQSNHDINSVAGVLKLYFRGLENPLFPKERFNDLISCISKWIFGVFFKSFPTRIVFSHQFPGKGNGPSPHTLPPPPTITTKFL